MPEEKNLIDGSNEAILKELIKKEFERLTQLSGLELLQEIAALKVNLALSFGLLTGAAENMATLYKQQTAMLDILKKCANETTITDYVNGLDKNLETKINSFYTIARDRLGWPLYKDSCKN